MDRNDIAWMISEDPDGHGLVDIRIDVLPGRDDDESSSYRVELTTEKHKLAAVITWKLEDEEDDDVPSGRVRSMVRMPYETVPTVEPEIDSSELSQHVPALFDGLMVAAQVYEGKEAHWAGSHGHIVMRLDDFVAKAVQTEPLASYPDSDEALRIIVTLLS